MNLVYKRICIAILAALMLVMIAALFVTDAQSRPVMTVSGILDGSYFRNYQRNYTDTFPTSKWMQDDFADLEAFYNFGEEAATEPQE